MSQELAWATKRGDFTQLTSSSFLSKYSSLQLKQDRKGGWGKTGRWDDVVAVLKEGWRRRRSPNTTSHHWLPTTPPDSPGLHQAPKAGSGVLPTLQQTPLQKRNGSQEASGSKTRQRHMNLITWPPKIPQWELCCRPSTDCPCHGHQGREGLC